MFLPGDSYYNRQGKDEAFLKGHFCIQTINTVSPKKLIPSRKPVLGEEKGLSQGQPEGNSSPRESPTTHCPPYRKDQMVSSRRDHTLTDNC